MSANNSVARKGRNSTVRDPGPPHPSPQNHIKHIHSQGSLALTQASPTRLLIHLPKHHPDALAETRVPGPSRNPASSSRDTGTSPVSLSWPHLPRAEQSTHTKGLCGPPCTESTVPRTAASFPLLCKGRSAERLCGNRGEDAD